MYYLEIIKGMGYPWIIMGYPWIILGVLGYTWVITFMFTSPSWGYLWVIIGVLRYPWVTIIVLRGNQRVSLDKIGVLGIS